MKLLKPWSLARLPFLARPRYTRALEFVLYHLVRNHNILSGLAGPSHGGLLHRSHLAARSQFPSLASGYIFADNAGGSQCTGDVVAHISDYLLNTNVQLGADYSVSVESTNRVKRGISDAAVLFNARSEEEIAFGSSSTLVAENLARGLEGDVLLGEELIITGEHEANAGPWKKLAARKGATIKLWNPRISKDSPNNPYAVSLDVEDLLPLITSKTRLVAFTACSNILGSIVPVKAVISAARARAKEVSVRKIEFSVDCVAYAPHRRIDVQDWDVDFCFFSFYKVYGPHIAALYARSASLESSITALTHHFLTVSSTSYKLQPGGPGYELVYGTSGVLAYLLSLTPSRTLTGTFEAIVAHERTIVEPLLAFLRSQEDRGVRIVGEENAGPTRVPTISFVVTGTRPIRSKDVVAAFDRKGGIGIRYGHFYAYTLVSTLSPNLDIDDAVVRVSLVHYNTVNEVEKVIEILKEVLA